MLMRWFGWTACGIAGGTLGYVLVLAGLVALVCAQAYSDGRSANVDVIGLGIRSLLEFWPSMLVAPPVAALAAFCMLRPRALLL
jgi:hypothetical protein